MKKLVKRVPKNHMNLGGELMARPTRPLHHINGSFHGVVVYTSGGWWDSVFLAGSRRPSRRRVKLAILKSGITPEFW